MTDDGDGDRDARPTAVAIGDSFVDGAGATDRYGWAYRLSDALDGYDVSVRGHGGDTVEDVLGRIEADVLELDPALVILQVGINDSRFRESFDTDRDVPPDRYEVGLRKFVSRVREASEAPTRVVVVGTVPLDERLTRPYKPDKEYTTSSAREYNRLARRVCDDVGAAFVEIFEAFETRGPNGELLDDGLHPNDDGHELICELVTAALRAADLAE